MARTEKLTEVWRASTDEALGPFIESADIAIDLSDEHQLSDKEQQELEVLGRNWTTVLIVILQQEDPNERIRMFAELATQAQRLK